MVPGHCSPRSPGPLLFPGGPGKTTTPENFTSLMNDLESKIFGRFDDDTVVHPGHGDDTTRHRASSAAGMVATRLVRHARY
jgi:glyoxylase-like metal-dependent hydrolase (beta-lactamase superfamily II)